MLQLATVGTAPGTTTLHFGSTIPTDIDKSRTYGYLPITSGILPGRVAQLGAQLGAAAGTVEEQLAALEVQQRALDVLHRAEELKTHRSMRIWTAITGLVGVAGLAVSVYSLRKKK